MYLDYRYMSYYGPQTVPSANGNDTQASGTSRIGPTTARFAGINQKHTDTDTQARHYTANR